ncbi:hypothetical protein MES5069_440230 [Mesorhizobium escarrei]|uniref:Uncharacterized protein n=1 Tax=Mesorhizobium escarrei TaxID=666018 RepID=A0ABM9E764_9HYPH|nr:hypothetical protein MES5069_440230 [Mesorhizobium escarrei]
MPDSSASLAMLKIGDGPECEGDYARHLLVETKSPAAFLGRRRIARRSSGAERPAEARRVRTKLGVRR